MKPVKILIVSDCVACAAHAPAGSVLTVSAQEAACLLGLGRATADPERIALREAQIERHTEVAAYLAAHPEALAPAAVETAAAPAPTETAAAAPRRGARTRA